MTNSKPEQGGAGNSGTATPAGARQSAPWGEALRRALSTRRRPDDFVLAVRCHRGHPLLWLVPGPDGVVPVTRTVEPRGDSGHDNPVDIAKRVSEAGPGQVTQTSVAPEGTRLTPGFHIRSGSNGDPVPLRDWPADELLPPASCACHRDVNLSTEQVRSWLGAKANVVTYHATSSTLPGTT